MGGFLVIDFTIPGSWRSSYIYTGNTTNPSGHKFVTSAHFYVWVSFFFHIVGTAVNTENNNPYCLAISFIVLYIIYSLLVGKPLRETKSIGHYETVIGVYKNHSKNHQIQ